MLRRLACLRNPKASLSTNSIRTATNQLPDAAHLQQTTAQRLLADHQQNNKPIRQLYLGLTYWTHQSYLDCTVFDNLADNFVQPSSCTKSFLHGVKPTKDRRLCPNRDFEVKATDLEDLTPTIPEHTISIESRTQPLHIFYGKAHEKPEKPQSDGSLHPSVQANLEALQISSLHRLEQQRAFPSAETTYIAVSSAPKTTHRHKTLHRDNQPGSSFCQPMQGSYDP